MSAGVREVEEGQLQTELINAGKKLVVVDFFATWCGPCRNIAPVIEGFSQVYPNAVFLKVDVDKCQDTAAAYNVTAMPTFILFKENNKLDVQKGADRVALEEKIKKFYGSGEVDEELGVKGHLDLSSFIFKGGCECLNESDDHPLDHCLTSKGGYLESDCDEQLIIALSFNQPVKLHSFKMQAPADKGPKNLKFFINMPRTLDFDQADSMEPVQSFEMTPEDLKEGNVINFRYVKFQNVQNIAIFVKDNQGGEETTQIDYLCLIGSPLTATNMTDFKRVAGKKGESH